MLRFLISPRQLAVWGGVLLAMSLLAGCSGSGNSLSEDSNSDAATPGGPGPAPPPSGWAVFDASPSGRAGQGVVFEGEFVGTDEIHFARGANADGRDHEEYYAPGGVPPEPMPAPEEQDDVYRHSTWGAFGADRAPHNGDYLLPTDTSRWPDFTADIAFLRFEATADDLFVQIRFVSFPAPDAQIATLTFTSVGAVPPFVPWPRNAGIGSAHSVAVTLWGDGGEVADSAGAAALLEDIGGAVRITDHAIEARIPLGSLPAGPWQVGAGSGLADPADPTQYWTVPAGAPTASSPGTDDANAPGSNVWDLMFTPRDPQWFDDHVQADLLAAGDVTSATIVVNPAVLQARASQPAPPIVGRVAHTYQSAFDFGDGIVRGSPGTPPVPFSAPAGVKPRDLAVNYEYTGAIQPYFAYIPSSYPASSHDWPLVLYFHGLNNYIWEPFGLTLGLEDELEARGYLFASLLGRGDISFEDRGELDPLEVIAHLRQRYRIDPSRIYLVGHSHGAGGVLNVSRRNPDLFAAVVPAQILDQPQLPENLRHVPTLHIAGQGDPIDSGSGARARYDALSALGYDSQYLLYSLKTHENSSIYDALPMIFDLYDRSVTPENPATVVYTRAGGDFNADLGLLHDGAYWVSDMVAADPAQDMHITAESFGIPHAPLDVAGATRTPDMPIDTGGPSGRSLAIHAQTTPDFGPPAAVEQRVSLLANNLAAVTLDTLRMAIDVRNAAVFELDIDHDLQLFLQSVSGSSLDWQVLNGAGVPIDSGTASLSNGSFEIPVPAAAVSLVFP